MSFNVYIGLRGSGKSSYAAKIARKYQRKGKKVFSNFPLSGCFLYDVRDLGHWDISNCVLILDEAGIDVNNRSFKSMSAAQLNFWKLSRHYGVSDIYVFSQAFDFDITLRRLADKMFILRKGFLGFSYLKIVKQYWDVDETGQPTIKWKILPFLFIPFWRPLYYHMFDSFAAPSLPVKEFPFLEPKRLL